MSIHAEGLSVSREVRRRVALRDSADPAEKMGLVDGAGMLNSVWNSSRMTLASVKSSEDPARCGWVAYSLEAASALSALGIDLE